MSGSIGDLGSGTLNPSIPLAAGRIGAAAANPLAQVEPVIRTMQGINQLKLFPGELQLQQQAIGLRGQALQKGTVDVAQRLYQGASQALLPILQKPDFTLDDL